MRSLKLKKNLSLVSCNEFAYQTNLEIAPKKVKKTKLEISHIIDNIFLSGIQPTFDHENLRICGITHIINCAAATKCISPVQHDDIAYLNLEMKDDPGFSILVPVFQSIDFIENALKNKGKILIHCMEGVSRGPTITACYLMWKYGFDKDYTVRLLGEKRDCVDLNFGFLIQISKFWKLLNSDLDNQVYLIDMEGRISFTEKEEFTEELSTNYGVIILFRNKKLHQIIMKERVELLEKSNKLLLFLRIYMNYPEECYTKIM